jgi:hypothetical protein
MNKTIVALTAALMLTGCSVGLQPGKEYLSMSFTAPITYQEAYRRAEATARKCQASGSNWLIQSVAVNGNVYSDNKTAELGIRMEGWNNDVERIDIKESTPGSSDVKITVWDTDWWDHDEMVAMRISIETGNVTCRRMYGSPSNTK